MLLAVEEYKIMAGATASPFPRTSKAFDFIPSGLTSNTVFVVPTPSCLDLGKILVVSLLT